MNSEREDRLNPLNEISLLDKEFREEAGYARKQLVNLGLTGKKLDEFYALCGEDPRRVFRILQAFGQQVSGKEPGSRCCAESIQKAVKDLDEGIIARWEGVIINQEEAMRQELEVYS